MKMLLRKKENVPANVVSKDFLDMKVVYSTDEGKLLTKEMFELLDTTMEDLHKAVMEMDERTPKLTTMADMIAALLEDGNASNLLENEGAVNPEEAMYVLNFKENGGAESASIVLRNDVLKRVREILQRDFYMCPSSIHEWIIVPYDDSIAPGEMSEMIRQINSEQVKPEQHLSNHVYFYSEHADMVIM